MRRDGRGEAEIFIFSERDGVQQHALQSKAGKTRIYRCCTCVSSTSRFAGNESIPLFYKIYGLHILSERLWLTSE